MKKYFLRRGTAVALSAAATAPTTVTPDDSSDDNADDSRSDDSRPDPLAGPVLGTGWLSTKILIAANIASGSIFEELPLCSIIPWGLVLYMSIHAYTHTHTLRSYIHHAGMHAGMQACRQASMQASMRAVHADIYKPAGHAVHLV